MGELLVTEQHRLKGFSKELITTTQDYLDKNYTIGCDCVPALRSRAEALGFKPHWNTYVAMLSLDKIARIARPFDGVI